MLVRLKQYKLCCAHRAQYERSRSRGDAYDCANEKVLVNNERVCPHHESDGVHKDNTTIFMEMLKSGMAVIQ